MYGPSAGMKPAYENPPAHAGEFTPDDFMYGASVSACSAEIQNGFLRKVYGLLSVQLLVTTAIGCWFMFHEQTRLFVTRTPSLLYLTFFASLGFLFACHCYKDKHPINLGLLGGFTLSIAYSVGVTCAVYQAHGLGYIVLQAFLLTAIITTALTTYTLRSKRDFSFLGAGLFGGLCALILGGLAHALIGWITGYGLGSGFSFVLALFGACIFSGYIVYDTWMISQKMSPDMYVQATIALYLDIVNLFIELLRILSYLQSGGDR